MSKRYKVVGPHPIDGHKPGDVFTPRHDDDHLGWLVAQGHLKPVQKATTKTNDKGLTASKE